MSRTIAGNQKVNKTTKVGTTFVGNACDTVSHMTEPNSPGCVNFKTKGWNIGDVIHFLEVAALLISIGVNYQRFTQIQTDVAVHTKALVRIEHYLSSQDTNYWHKAHQNGDGDQ